jgi:tetratricopeptide (TPR) repeat protein
MPKYITIYRHGDTNIVDIVEKGPISSKGEIKVEKEFLDGICREINRITLLANKMFYGMDNKNGQIVQEELKKIGSILFTQLLPANVQRDLQKGENTELYLKLDDQLIYIPWELCFDGQNFLTIKFMIGRQVRTDQVIQQTQYRKDSQVPLKMLIIIDPTESLKHAQYEAESLCSILEDNPNIEIELIGGRQADKLSLISEMRNKDLIHFIGHAFFDEKNPERSGWILKEGILTSQEMGRMDTSPLLVFSNSCQSVATTNWDKGYLYEEKAFGIGNGFLMSGVQNFIGPLWVIHDEGSARLASIFYKELIIGETIGKSLQKAKNEVLKKGDFGDLLWAGYIHYGDPATTIATKDKRILDDAKKPYLPNISSKIPTGFALNLRKLSLILGIPAILILGYLSWVNWLSDNSEIDYSFFADPKNAILVKQYEDAYKIYKSGKAQEALKIFEELILDDNNQLGLGYDGLAALYFERGDINKARETIRESLARNTKNMMSYVIRGDILFTEGKKDEAITEFYQALEITDALNWQKARANNAIAIGFLTDNKIEKAREYFQKALSLEPENTDTLFNLGLLSWKLGEKNDAISFLKKVMDLNQDEDLAHYYMDIINKLEINEGKSSIKILMLSLSFDGGHLTRMGVGEAIAWIIGQKLEEESDLNIISSPSFEAETKSMEIGFHRLSDSVTAMNMGKAAKVDYVIYGSYRIFENTIEVDIRAVNVKTTEIVTIEHQKASGGKKD